MKLLSQTPIEYEISFHHQNLNKPYLKVKVSVTLPEISDSSYWHYSNSVWGETNLFQCLKKIKGSNNNIQYRFQEDSNRIILYHNQSKKISFTYLIQQDYPGDSLHIFHRPNIKNNYFHILGQSLFIIPEFVFRNDIDPELNVSINWIGFPNTYTLHNSFGNQQIHQKFITKIWSGLFNSYFIGGDYRIHQFKYKQKNIYLAIRGNWKVYTDSELLVELQKAALSQRTFWNDSNSKDFTVFISPTISRNDSLIDYQSMKGSRILNGFILLSSNNPFNNWKNIKYIFNHELMHEWIGGIIEMKHEELNYWFSEGFTDYYAWKIRLYNDDISFEEWIDWFNRKVFWNYYKSPVYKMPNYVIKDHYWENNQIQKLPYIRGAIFAFILDNQILLNSNYNKSLDDLLKELLHKCSSENIKFTDELFLELVEKYTQKDFTYLFQKNIIVGNEIEFSNLNFINGINVDIVDSVPVIKTNLDSSTLKKIFLRKNYNYSNTKLDRQH